MKTRIFILLSFILASLSCSKYDGEVSITDVEKYEGININSKNNSNAYSLTVVGSGVINGKAKITLLLNEKPYKTELLDGNVNFKWAGDWYSKNAHIIYEPSGVVQGYLKLEYKFESL